MRAVRICVRGNAGSRSRNEGWHAGGGANVRRAGARIIRIGIAADGLSQTASRSLAQRRGDRPIAGTLCRDAILSLMEFPGHRFLR